MGPSLLPFSLGSALPCSQLPWILAFGKNGDGLDLSPRAVSPAGLLHIPKLLLHLHLQNGPSYFAVEGLKSAIPFRSRALQHGPESKQTFILAC